MKANHQRTLVLNADYLPMGIISWKRAIALSILNQGDPMEGLQPVDFYKDDFITTTRSQRYPIPAVVRCPNYIKRHRKGVPFSRKNVFLRDRLTCQYCGYTDGTTKKLTYDHVIPRAVWKKKDYQGTPTRWNNIVTCCEPCNKKKADKTPKQAKMRLLKEPKSPNPNQYILGLSPWCKVPEEWELYLTPMYKHLKSDNRPASC